MKRKELMQVVAQLGLDRRKYVSLSTEQLRRTLVLDCAGIITHEMSTGSVSNAQLDDIIQQVEAKFGVKH